MEDGQQRHVDAGPVTLGEPRGGGVPGGQVAVEEGQGTARRREVGEQRAPGRVAEGDRRVVEHAVLVEGAALERLAGRRQAEVVLHGPQSVANGQVEAPALGVVGGLPVPGQSGAQIGQGRFGSTRRQRAVGEPGDERGEVTGVQVVQGQVLLEDARGHEPPGRRPRLRRGDPVDPRDRLEEPGQSVRRRERRDRSPRPGGDQEQPARGGVQRGVGPQAQGPAQLRPGPRQSVGEAAQPGEVELGAGGAAFQVVEAQPGAVGAPPGPAGGGEGALRAGLGRGAGQVTGEAHQGLGAGGRGVGRAEPAFDDVVEVAAAVQQPLPEAGVREGAAQAGDGAAGLLLQEVGQGRPAPLVARPVVEPAVHAGDERRGQGGAHGRVPLGGARRPAPVGGAAQTDDAGTERRIGQRPDGGVQRVGDGTALGGDPAPFVQDLLGQREALTGGQGVQRGPGDAGDAHHRVGRGVHGSTPGTRAGMRRRGSGEA